MDSHLQCDERKYSEFFWMQREHMQILSYRADQTGKTTHLQVGLEQPNYMPYSRAVTTTPLSLWAEIFIGSQSHSTHTG